MDDDRGEAVGVGYADACAVVLDVRGSVFVMADVDRLLKQSLHQSQYGKPFAPCLFALVERNLLQFLFPVFFVTGKYVQKLFLALGNFPNGYRSAALEFFSKIKSHYLNMFVFLFMSVLYSFLFLRCCCR